MNENDYDEDGNNIVPCPICLSTYCPNNKDDGGKCPDAEQFIRTLKQRENVEKIRERVTVYVNKQFMENGRIIDPLELFNALTTQENKEDVTK